MRYGRSSKLESTFIGAGIIFMLMYITLILAGIYGYVSNIINIAHSLGDPITGMFIARLVGVIAFPLGAVLGYF